MATDEVDSFLRGVASAPALRPPPRVGERLGDRYVIEAFVGEGGMGSVYRALDEKLGEQVALKIVKPGLDEAALRDEVRLAQKVTHVNVCRTFDLEDVDGRQIVKMEYIAGETLATRLEREGKLPIDEAVHIARAIATGLGVAHAQGIVHSDLKPGNVMLADKRVVLMDFGVAHLAASPNEGVHGTVGYLAPEKLREESGDARSDEYALGCVLYEMLAGERVFGTGAAIVTAARHVSDPAPDVRKKRPEVPRWLALATSALLAKEPAARDAGVVRLAAGQRSPVRIAVPVVVVLAVALVIGVRLMRHPWVPKIWDPPSASDENLDSPAFSPDGKWILYASDRLEKDRLDHRERWNTFLMSRSTGASTRFEIPSSQIDSGDARWTHDGTSLLVLGGMVDAQNPERSQAGFIRQRYEGDPPHLVGPQTLVARFASDADDCGDAVVYTLRSSQGWRLMLSTGSGPDQLLFKAGPMHSLSAPRCDPAGARVATVVGANLANAPAGGNVYVIDRATRIAHAVTNDDSVMSSAVFSADGTSLIFSRVIDDRVQLFELPVEGESFRRLTFDVGPDGSPDVSRDGRELLFTQDTTSWVPAIFGVDGSRRFLTRERGIYFYAFPLTSDILLYERIKPGHSNIVLLHIATTEIQVLADGTAPFAAFDHKQIYFAKLHDPRTLEVVSVDGGAATAVATLPGPIVAGSGGPDGNHVLVEIGGELFGYRVGVDGRMSDEHTHGIVSVAPSGGWRAVTVFGPVQQSLSLFPPGAMLDHPSKTIQVVSLTNRWLDDHTITYCITECVELDANTGATKIIKTQVDPNFYAIEIDDTHVVATATQGEATMHVITNFADR